MTVTTTTPTVVVTATVEVETAAVIHSVILEGRMGLMERGTDSRGEEQERMSPPSSSTTLFSPQAVEDTSSTVEVVEVFWSMVRDLPWRKVRVRATVEGGRGTDRARDCRGLYSWK